MKESNGNKPIEDPRHSVVEKKLGKVKRVIAIAGGKGGTGKSLVAATLAKSLSENGYKTGLLDLDLTGPSAHLILGESPGFPEEDNGVIPANASGISFSSIIQYAGDSPSPLRGGDISNAILEILAITRWGSLDFLIIDMPPGISDAMLDIIKLVRRCEFVMVATPSKVVVETVRKNILLLQEIGVPILGIIENMTNMEPLNGTLKKSGIKLLGKVPYDRSIETAIGNPSRILDTKFGQSMSEICSMIAGGKEK